jgi:hypothetical protein
MLPQIASDGAGGAFVCWRDARSGKSYDVYAQHIAKDGKMLWQKNGIPIVDDPANQQYPRIVGTGKGDAFIAWEDDRSGNTYIYVQRINGDRLNYWQKNGVKAAEFGGLFISLSLDKRGGCLIAWNGNGSNYVIAQCLDSLGNRMWGDSGVIVSNRPDPVASNDVAIISDDHDGALVAWSQGEYLKEQVFIQSIDSTGKTIFSSNGIPVSDTRDNICVSISSDRHGGGIISWARFANGPVDSSAIFVQRVTNTGIFLWGRTGISLNATVGGGAWRHTDDGCGGVYIGHSKYIQHIDSSGNKLWAGEGAQFTSAPTLFFNSSQARNGIKGIWNFWTYQPTDTTYMLSDDIYWGNLGKPICSMPYLQDRAQAISNDDGTAIVVWHDTRNANAYTAVYAARVDTGDVLTDVKDFGKHLFPQRPELEQNYPNPFNPETTISFSLSERSFVQLIVYDLLGRKIKTLLEEERNPGQHSIRFDSKDLGSGTYFYCLMANNKMIAKKMMVLR